MSLYSTLLSRMVGLTFIGLATLPVFAHASTTPLSLLSNTPLPDVTGGDFDHFAVDMTHHRLYVSSEKYASIEAFRLPDGAQIASYKEVAKSPHKILLAKDGHQMFIADAGDANVKIVNTDDFKVTQSIPMVPQPDTGVVDRQHGIFYVGNGGKQSNSDTAYITSISIADGTVLGRIPVPGAQVKAMVIDPQTHRLFVNLREKRQVAVIDLATRKIVSLWDVPGPSVNSAMAIDTVSRRLFIGSRAPGRLIVLDADSGAIVQSINIVDVSDDMTFDAPHKRLYVTGAGGLDVVKQDDPNHYSVEQHIDTLGGKTSVYIPALKRFYVVHTKGPQAIEAGLQIFSVK